MSTPLLDRLHAHPGAFDFYQAVRLLERVAGGGVSPGDGADPAAEPVRFRAAGDFAYPPADLVAVRPGPRGQPEMTVAFMALGGAQGPLPVPLAERAMDQLADHDTATRDFLDLFHHRLVSLAYRIGRRTRPVLQEALPEKTETAGYLRALVGLGTPGLQRRLPGVDDRALLARAGLLAHEVRSQAGLQGLLADHFGVPVDVEPLVGRWLAIPDDQRTRIGRTGASRTLGSDAVLGARWHDPAAAVGIRLGPMGIDLYRAFLPADPVTGDPADGRALVELRELVRFYAGVETDFVLTLVLRAAEVPRTRLSAARTAESARLGWSAWVRTRPFIADAEVRVDPARACGCAPVY
ncbi:MAG TPA: type VI secretion system baseplate subunit TssG [Longimicrobium sp.]|nr:type VI secretion system baseplate subunit TssG [Longimicrobium sp.]